ncbi:MAG: glycosyltransferase family 39 protein [bacterium]
MFEWKAGIDSIDRARNEQMRSEGSSDRNARSVGIAALLVNIVLCVFVHLLHAVSGGWGALDEFLPNFARLSYHSLTIIPIATGVAFLVALMAFKAHAHSTGTSLGSVLRIHLNARRFWAVALYLIITFPWGHRVKSGFWVPHPWLPLFYRWLLLTLVLVQVVFLLRLLRQKPQPLEVSSGSAGASLSRMRSAECGVRNEGQQPSSLNPQASRLTPRCLPPTAYCLLFLAMGVVFIETNLISWKVLDHVAHVEDAIAQLFQAKCLSIGRWFLNPSPVPDAFLYPHVILQERLYGIYPPGFPLVLALGVLIGMPWLVNPILATLTVPALYMYGKRMYGQNVALLAVVLLCFSPFFLVMGSSMMNHPLSLLVLLLFALALERAKTKWSGFLFSGFLAGYSFIVRPLTALGVGIPLGIFFILEERERRSRWGRGVLLFLVGLLPCVACMLVANVKTTGHPFISGYQKYFDNNPLGFGNKPWGENPAGYISSHGVDHTPLLGLANWSINLNDANRDLFGWPIAGLLPIVYLWLARRSPNREDYKMLWICVGLGIAYVFYYYQDICYGPRNIYECLPYALLLVSRGLLTLSEDISETLRLTRRQLIAASLAVFFCLECVTAVTTGPRLYHRYRRTYWRVTGELRNLTLRSDLDNAIVFVHSGLNYGNGFQLNPPDMVSGPLFPEDYAEDVRAKVIAAYPDRPVYYAVEQRIENGRAIPELTRRPPD